MVPSAAMWSPLGHQAHGHNCLSAVVTYLSMVFTTLDSLSKQCMKMIRIIISLVYLARVLFIAKSNTIINSMNM